MSKTVVKKKRGVPKGKNGHSKCGFFGGELKDSWRAAFDYRQKILKELKYISCSEAMAELTDDAGNCPFSKWDITKHQWKLQRMFTQLEADDFKEPTKGEHYVMLYEILYGGKSVAIKVGEAVEVVEVDLEPTEKVIIIREMLKMGGHYAPEKSEHKFDLTRTEHIIMELYKMEKADKVKELDDSKNRIKKHLQN